LPFRLHFFCLYCGPAPQEKVLTTRCDSSPSLAFVSLIRPLLLRDLTLHYPFPQTSPRLLLGQPPLCSPPPPLPSSRRRHPIYTISDLIYSFPLRFRSSKFRFPFLLISSKYEHLLNFMQPLIVIFPPWQSGATSPVPPISRPPPDPSEAGRCTSVPSSRSPPTAFLN